MNEALRRAFLQAGLTEEDVAARLEVDPKTVRRWMEGRIPYLRHRWAIAGLVGIDETELWPQLRARSPMSAEILAVYPHLDEIPSETWQRLFGSGSQEINILSDSGLALAEDQCILAALDDRARAGASVRICLRDPAEHDFNGSSADEDAVDKLAQNSNTTLALYGKLRGRGEVVIRLHRAILNNSIYRADNELLVGLHAYGIPDGRGPGLYLHRAERGEMFTTYLDSFYHVWEGADDAWPPHVS